MKYSYKLDATADDVLNLAQNRQLAESRFSTLDLFYVAQEADVIEFIHYTLRSPIREPRSAADAVCHKSVYSYRAGEELEVVLAERPIDQEEFYSRLSEFSPAAMLSTISVRLLHRRDEYLFSFNPELQLSTVAFDVEPEQARKLLGTMMGDPIGSLERETRLVGQLLTL